jgi:phenylacetate-CoA ligase
MLEYCFRTVPYYHLAMREAGILPRDVKSIDDLRLLPRVEKAAIRKNPSLFRSRCPPNGVYEASTYGSTGEPFRFLRSRGVYEWEVSGTLRAMGWTGYERGDRWANIHRISRSESLPDKFAAAARDIVLRRLRVDDWKISREGLEKQAARIVSFQPFLVEAFPKSLLEFGHFAREQDARVPAVISVGEGITRFERSLLGESWGAEVYDRYACAEAMAIGSECSEHQGLHVSDELYVLEFVKDGEHVSPGETGRILVTSLYHQAQPFIRYDLGDLSTPIGERCRCGRGLGLMSSVEGRCEDVLETEDGRLIFSHTFTDWVGDVGVRQYQIEQLGRFKMTIRIVPDESYTEEIGARISARARAVLGPNVSVEVRVVDSIRDYQSGKRQIVKSRVRFPP